MRLTLAWALRSSSSFNLARAGSNFLTSSGVQKLAMSNSNGNLTFFKIFALIRSWGFHWKRTKLTVKYSGRREILEAFVYFAERFSVGDVLSNVSIKPWFFLSVTS
jgi:hypothetical protein